LLWGRAQAQSTAEEEELTLVYGDKGTVSIATGSKQPLRRAPAVATVVTAQEIAAMGATDLDDVLETVPGIHVSRNYQAYNPLYVIRGIYSEFNPQTLVLQNGVPMTTLFVGNRGTLWASYPVENIARIEVIRGPGSALYGADAYSGVINIITKTAADIDGAQVGVRAGSFSTRQGWTQYGGRLGPVEVAAYLQGGRTDGFQRTVDADAQTGLDALFGTHASLAPGSVNTGHRDVDGNLDLAYGGLRLRANYKLRYDIGTALGAASALDPVGKGRSERTTLDASWNDIDLAKDWKLGLAASGLQYVQTFPTPLQLFPPGAFGGAFPDGMIGAPQTWERQLRVSAVLGYSGFAGHGLRLGVGHDDLDMYRTQELKNFSIVPSGPLAGLPVPTASGGLEEFPVEDSFATPHRRQVSYVYLQDEWNLARDWTLTAGVRHDKYSDFGRTTNPRLALVWDASLDLTAKLLYGQAFRAPSFTEEYSINNPVIRGNAALKPETIRTLEAAFSWQARSDLQLNLSLFRYRMRDIIRTVSTGGGTAMFDNVGTQHGHGAELEATWDPSRALRLTGSYAYQHSIDDASGQDAGYAPHHHLYARADWSFTSGWLLSTQADRVAGRRRPAGDPRPDIADYTTVDAALRTSFGRHGWTFAATARNLFNADAREPSLAPGTALPNDLPMAPRSLMLSASYSL
jgi:iron complex outermembrane receptor protein